MSAVALQVSVLGVGLWADGLGTWDEARARWRGQAGQAPIESKPQTTLLPPAERRRAPATVLLALAVAEQACREAGCDVRGMRSVFTSAHGDLELTDHLCATLADSPEHLSPTKFHHSVHNAASGYWTIGVGNRQASTALSAGRYSFAQGLLEAATQAVCEQVPVLLVAYDMPAPKTLAPITGSTALAGLALVLAPLQAPASARPVATLAMHLHDTDEPEPAPVCPSPDIAALAHRNPMATGLPWLHALARQGLPGAEAYEARFMLSPGQSLVMALRAIHDTGTR